jgi:hypothetical protein
MSMFVDEYAIANPIAFVVQLNIAWGSVCSSLFVTTIVVYNYGRKYVEKFPKRKLLFTLLWIIWVIFHLAAVFSLPLLVISWERRLGTSDTMGALVLLFTLIFNLVFLWWIMRNFEKFE